MNKFFALCVVVFAFSLPAGAGIIVFPVQVDSNYKDFPAVSGNYVSWRDHGRGGIYAKNLSTNELLRLGECAPTYSNYEPNSEFGPYAGGNTIVWEENTGSKPSNIHAYNLLTRADLIVGQNFGNYLTACPRTDGNNVVWVNDGVLNGYSFANGLPFTLPLGGWQARLDIDGDVVVWEDGRSGNSDIYGYRISTGTEFPIHVGINNQSRPAISGNFVVWQEDFLAGGRAIYSYNLLTSEENQINSTGPFGWGASHPAISGNIVIWEDGGWGDYDILGYNLLTKESFTVYTGIGEQYWPAIDKNLIVWSDFRNGNPWDINADIYGVTVPEPTAMLPLSLILLALWRRH